MPHRFHFLQCVNPACDLRFPLDLDQYQGWHCPRCGSKLTAEAALPSYREMPKVPKARRISVLLDNIRSAHNVGAILRTADGAGVSKVYLCGITPQPKEHPAIAKTALGAEESLAWEYQPNALHLLQALQAQELDCIALEASPDSSNLFEFQPPEGPLLLMVGNEAAGLDPQLLRMANTVLHLPMQGMKNSLNVAEAFSIAAYHLSFAI